MNKFALSLGSLAVASALLMTGCVYDDVSYEPQSNYYIYDPVPIGGVWGPPPARNSHHHKHHHNPPPPVVVAPQPHGYAPPPVVRHDHPQPAKHRPQPGPKPGKPVSKPIPQPGPKPGKPVSKPIPQPQQRPKVGKPQQQMKFMPMKKGAKYLN